MSRLFYSTRYQTVCDATVFMPHSSSLGGYFMFARQSGGIAIGTSAVATVGGNFAWERPHLSAVPAAEKRVEQAHRSTQQIRR